MHAIASAAISYTLAQVCIRETPASCQCDTSGTANSGFDWGGCGNNIDSSIKLSKLFVDSEDSGSRDARALMNLHNSNAGRKVSALISLIDIGEKFTRYDRCHPI